MLMQFSIVFSGHGQDNHNRMIHKAFCLEIIQYNMSMVISTDHVSESDIEDTSLSVVLHHTAVVKDVTAGLTVRKTRGKL